MADALKVIILHNHGFALRVLVLLKSEALPSLKEFWGKCPMVYRGLGVCAPHATSVLVIQYH